MKIRSHALLIALIAIVVAECNGNVNYGSPSLSHRSLGISMPKLMKRQASTSYMSANTLKITHDVVSGDPYSTSVILRTRAAPIIDNDKSNITVEGTVPLYNPDTQEYVRASRNPICVSYEVAMDSNLNQVATSDKAYTSSDIDYTVKVEAKGLQPFT